MAMEFIDPATGNASLTTDGTYGPLKISGNNREGYNWFAHGTTDGATITLSVSFDKGANYVEIEDASFADVEGQLLLNLRGSFWLQAEVSSAGGSTDIYSGIA